MRVLSFNSHVSYGQVGHNVTKFVAQEYAIPITAIHTVNFSNHPGYGSFSGTWMEEEELCAHIESLEKLGLLKKHSAVISGYLGKAGTANVIENVVKKIKSQREIEYFLDPVMGDSDKGFYVSRDVANAIKSKLLPIADYIMPNVFELEFLSEREIKNCDDIQSACNFLISRYNLKGILVTSVEREEKIGMLFFTQKEQFERYTQKFDFEFIPRGSGDFISALFLVNKILGKKSEKVVEKLSTIIYNSFKLTYEKREQELFLYRERSSHEV